MATIKRRNKLLNIATISTLIVQTYATSSSYDGHYSSYIDSQRYANGLITSCEYPGTHGYFILNENHPYSNAANACASFGGSLADLDNNNFLLASDLVLTCAGPNKRAWIGYVYLNQS